MAKPEITPEVQAYIDEMIDGLKSKRDELLAEVKNLKKGKQIDPADVEKLDAEIDRLKGELTAAQKAEKTAKKDAETAAAALTQESAFTQGLLIENGLSAALTEAKVPPQFLKAAMAMLKSGAAVVADGDKRVAKIGDKPLSEAVKAWAASDEGKHFVAAAGNAGGGAAGGAGKADGALTMTRTAFDSLPPGQQSEFGKKGGTLTAG